MSLKPDPLAFWRLPDGARVTLAREGELWRAASRGPYRARQAVLWVQCVSIGHAIDVAERVYREAWAWD